eukprot:9118043-Pyramimonas_sp.AAC.1
MLCFLAEISGARRVEGAHCREALHGHAAPELLAGDIHRACVAVPHAHLIRCVMDRASPRSSSQTHSSSPIPTR